MGDNAPLGNQEPSVGLVNGDGSQQGGGNPGTSRSAKPNRAPDRGDPNFRHAARAPAIFWLVGNAGIDGSGDDEELLLSR